MLNLDVDRTLTLVYIFLMTIRLDFNFEINRFYPVLVETDLIYDNHDGTSCWTVIVLKTTGLRFCSRYYVYITVYMLPALRGPSVSYLMLFGFARLTGGSYASVFISMDGVHFVWLFFIPADCLFFFRTVILCFILLFLGDEVSGRSWGGGSRSPV